MASEAQRVYFEHFVCGLTRQLPLAPVVAEDGYVYEKEALLDWFAGRGRLGGSRYASPADTSKAIGRGGMHVSEPVRSAIGEYVRTNAAQLATWDAARSWLVHLEQEEAEASLTRRAETGDTSAMLELGRRAGRARPGRAKDDEQATRHHPSPTRTPPIPPGGSTPPESTQPRSVRPPPARLPPVGEPLVSGSCTSWRSHRLGGVWHLPRQRPWHSDGALPGGAHALAGCGAGLRAGVLLAWRRAG